MVEVVLALGIATFAIVAMLGLLRVALDTDGDAGRDTVVAAMAAQVLSELRDVPFDALWYVEPNLSRSAAPSTNPPVDSRAYFTQEGVHIPPAEVNPQSFPVFYECVVKKTPDERTRNANSGAYNQLKLQIEFTWPAFVPNAAQRQSRKTIHASIARY
jgi:hypothetical protein